jgi:uncharacterized tellurite resistance protein B-like protein
MFPDPVGSFPLNERLSYAHLLVHLAAADGTLVREEVQAIEGYMGKYLIPPEQREEIRSGFDNPKPLGDLLTNLSHDLLHFVLRDAIVVASIDGEYDQSEIDCIRAISDKIGLSDEGLSKVFDWVKSGWKWNSEYKNLITKNDPK